MGMMSAKWVWALIPVRYWSGWVSWSIKEMLLVDPALEADLRRKGVRAE
jgi:hypothetical protein